jgi:hypothetical protein
MRRLSVISILGCLLAIPALRATTIRFVTPPGAVAGGLPISADAVFNVTANSIIVTLTNYVDDPSSTIQNLNAMTFQVGGSSLQQLVLTSSSAPEVSVPANGKPSYFGASDTGWQIASSGTTSARTASLYVLGTPAAPEHTLMGGPDLLTGHYDNADSTILKNDTNSPFLLRQAVYVLSAPGVLPTSTIGNVVFSFGTTAGTDFTGVQAAPEPSTFALLGCGAALILASAGMRKAWGKNE